MKINVILACTKQGFGCVIGSKDTNNQPFHIKEDLKRFQKLTKDKVIVMGRNTWKAIGEFPLKNRTNIVITADSKFEFNQKLLGDSILDVGKYASIEDVIEEYKDKEEEIFFIGGANLINSLQKKYKVDNYLITFVHNVDKVNSPIHVDLNTDGYKVKSISLFDGVDINTNKIHPCTYIVYSKD